MIALEQAVMQSQEPFGVTVQLFDSIYYVDVIGLSPSVHCPVANLHCQIAGDNSDAIGGQHVSQPVGGGLSSNHGMGSLFIGLHHLIVLPALTLEDKIMKAG